jgi:hypothetical protein
MIMAFKWPWRKTPIDPPLPLDLTEESFEIKKNIMYIVYTIY